MRTALIILVMFAAAVTVASAQYYPPVGQGELAPPQGAVDLDENGNPIEAPQDSTKKVKIRKPLESYFFDDSLRNQRYFSWTANLSGNRVEVVPVDTTAHSTQPYHPFTPYGVAWQGNMGGAVYPLNYAERPQYENFSFAQGFDAYNIFPESALFYNVKTPLTFFSYYMSGQSKRFEEGFSITHAQNISPSSGFNIDYRSQGTRGFYGWSKGRDKNLSLAFSHTGRRYTVHGGYIYNTTNNKENGGVVNDRYITDTILELSEAVPVRLKDARNVIKGNTAYIVQSYGFPLRRLADSASMSGSTSLFVGHSAHYSKWDKLYTDTRAGSRYNQIKPGSWDYETESTTENGQAVERVKETEFYNDWLLNRDATFDSISESLFSNRAFVQIQPYDREGIVGLIDAGVGTETHRYSMFHPRNYLSGRYDVATQTDYFVDGSIGGRVSRYFGWGGSGHYHPMGERRGDFELEGVASLSAFVRERPITLSGRFVTTQKTPSYWDENLVSNHFMWSNNFEKESESRLHVQLDVPSWSLEIGATQSVATDKIYYDATMRPAQEAGTVSVTGAYVDKLFRLGGWRLRHRVMVQESSDQRVVPVPLATAYLSYSFEFDVVRNVLRARIGLDGYYNTPYYAPGWMPATARFYNQREKELGGYPLVDAFVAAKWKRMRILLKMEHVNENLFGKRNYFTLLHYPLHKRTFKVGFTWAFYD